MGQEAPVNRKPKFPLQPGVNTKVFSIFALLYFVVTHLVVAVWLVAYASWELYFLTLFVHTICGVGITLGAHRYFSHKTFNAPMWLENLLAFAYTLSFVRAGHGLIGWVAAHRFHHSFVDLDLDPHTPKHGTWHAYAGHFIHRRADLWDFEQYKHYRPDLAKKPFLVFLDKPMTIMSIQLVWTILVVMVGGLTGGGVGFDWSRSFGFFVWVICARYVFTQFSHSLAATAAHGTWPFGFLKDTFHTGSDAKNNLSYWLATFGSETWHNVHHAFPKAANNGPYWYHWDLDAFIMYALAKLKIVSGLMLINKEQYETGMSRNTFEGRNGRRVYIPNGMGWRYFNHADLMPKELRERVEHLAYTYGRSYDSYLVTEPDREYFMNSKDDAVISFVTVGRYVNVVGGAIGTDEARAELLKSFLDFCRQNSLTCSFFSILGDEIDQYRGLGFEVTKFGEDFRIDVSKLDWSGKNFSWVRRQVHYVQKNGVVARELRRSDVLEESWNAQLAELREVERGQLATKSQGEPTKVFQGQITSPDLGRRRLFAAYDSQSRAECFLVCNPIDGGNSWAIEIYRHRLDCTRGSMAFLFHHTLSMLKSEGCQVVSLSMNPAIRCQDPLPGDSALCRNILIFWDKHLNFLLDLRGVYHFKSRFRPAQVPVYLCVYPKVTVGSTWAFLKCCGLIKLNPGRMLLNCLSQLRKWRVRKNLSRPKEVANA